MAIQRRDRVSAARAWSWNQPSHTVYHVPVALVAEWKRRTIGAAGASLVLPFALLGVAALIAVGGSGVGGLGALAQLASGPAPAEPPDAATVATSDAQSQATALLLPDTAAQAAASGASDGGAPGVGGGSEGQVPVGGGGAPEGDQNAPATPPPSAPGDDAPVGGGDGTIAQPAPTPAPGQGGAVDRLGGEVEEITQQLGPVGGALDRLIDPVINTCRQLRCP